MSEPKFSQMTEEKTIDFMKNMLAKICKQHASDSNAAAKPIADELKHLRVILEKENYVRSHCVRLLRICI